MAAACLAHRQTGTLRIVRSMIRTAVVQPFRGWRSTSIDDWSRCRLQIANDRLLRKLQSGGENVPRFDQRLLGWDMRTASSRHLKATSSSSLACPSLDPGSSVDVVQMCFTVECCPVWDDETQAYRISWEARWNARATDGSKCGVLRLPRLSTWSAIIRDGLFWCGLLSIFVTRRAVYHLPFCERDTWTQSIDQRSARVMRLRRSSISHAALVR